MKMTIDEFSVTTGWVTGAGSTMSAHMLNQHSDFIAGNNTSSLVLKVPAGNTGKYIQKAITKDLTGYDDIVFHIWSRTQKTNDYPKSTSYKYKIEFGTATIYYVPTRMDFCEVVLHVTGTTTIDKIKITALHNEEDYIIISHMIACADEVPLDILQGIKDKLEYDLIALHGNGILLGTVTMLAGDKYITFTGNWVERYACLVITNGVNTEKHIIKEIDGSTVWFGQPYDGDVVKYSMTGASVYLFVPVEFGRMQMEIILPSITVWGITPERVWRGAGLDSYRDTWKTTNTTNETREGAIFKYDMMIDCEARHNELIALLSNVVRKFIACQTIWINGRRFTINFEGIPTEVEPTQAFEVIPKIQYVLSVEIKEDIWSRVVKPIIITTHDTYTITDS